MDSNTFVIAAGAVNGFFLLGALGLWLRYRERRAAQKPQPSDDRVIAELQELRSAIDAVAVEVERLGEGQRFVTRALAERGAAPAAPPAPAPRAGQGRVVTPH